MVIDRVAEAKQLSEKSLRSYTTAQVSSHNTKGDAWIIYENRILDVSKWIASHPGGEQTILRFAGMDATDELRAFHDDWVLETKLQNFVIRTTSTQREAASVIYLFSVHLTPVRNQPLPFPPFHYHYHYT